MQGHDDNLINDLVDAQLQYLQGRGTAPDLTDLNDEDRTEIAQILELVEVLADSLPAPPPIDEDPVAIQLALAEAMDVSIPDVRIPTPVMMSVQDLCSRFGGAIQPEVADASPSIGIQAALMCRSLSEVVIISIPDVSELPKTSRDALPIFIDHPEVTAVAFSSPDASRATVVTNSQSVGYLIPAEDHVTFGELHWEPLGIALGRYLERSIPRWEEVNRLPADETLDPLVVDVTGVVNSQLHRVRRLRPRLPHKREARDFVAQVKHSRIKRWVEAARTGEVSRDALISDVIATCEVPGP